MTACQYKFDNTQCVKTFAHDGNHEIPLPRPLNKMEWHYEAEYRDADAARGYPQCLDQHMMYTCTLRLGHEGALHAEEGDSDVIATWTHEDIETPAAPPEPEPKAADPRVTSALSRRADHPTHAIAVNAGGSPQRFQIIDSKIVDGSLRLALPDSDVVYAAGAWKSYSEEPTWG